MFYAFSAIVRSVNPVDYFQETRDKMANSLFTKVSKRMFTETMNPKANEATQLVLEEEDFIVSMVALDNHKWCFLYRYL